MSVSGYFEKIKPELRMPRSEKNSPDELGISFDGAVMNGKMSVLDALQLAALAAKRTPSQGGNYLDPVLRFHLRLPNS